jgi:hypothetical protein
MRARRALARTSRPEVAAAFDPIVVLFGEHGADEADYGVAGGEDANEVGASADFPVEAFLGVV